MGLRRLHHRSDWNLDVLVHNHGLEANERLCRIIVAAALLLATWEHSREEIRFLNDFVNRLQRRSLKHLTTFGQL